MSQEQFPQPEQPQQPPVEQGRELENSFVKDAANIHEALNYIDEVEPKWVLEPTEVTVEQPQDQEQLLGNLDHMLSSQEGGDKLSAMLQGNLAAIRSKIDAEGPGAAKLSLKAGFNMGELDTSGMSKAEYHKHRRNGSTTEEYIDDPDQPNVMLTGLLLATGAENIRDDVAEGNGTGKRVYKGMLEGKPVYFTENILPRVVENEDGSKSTILERSVWAETEQSARHSLNSLSETDADVLKSIGVEMPMIGSSEYNQETYPNRSRMIETLRLYAAMNPMSENEPVQPHTEQATAETIPSYGMEITPGQVEVLKKQQAERDKQEEVVISNFRAHGATDEQIQGYRADIARMKDAELKRGRLFPHQSGFVRFETLSKPEQGLGMGVGSGFEQGDDLLVQRTSGTVEGGWTFLGVDEKTGLAEVARFDETGNRLYKSYPLDDLRKLNRRTNK